MRIQATIVCTSLVLAVSQVAAVPVSLHPDVQIRRVMDMPGARRNSTVRMDVDRRDNTVYSITQRGEIHRLTLAPEAGGSSAEPVFDSADHGIGGGVQGFAIGPDGSFYISSNSGGNASNTTVGTITKGLRDPSGTVTWHTLARTVEYGRCDCIWNHQVNGLIASPDNRLLYINSGSRTDHGEVEETNGLFPGAREMPITSSILRVPTDGENITIPNDEDALRAGGFKYATGFRNTFDLAYGPNGDLFATENGPDADLPEEINWIREGRHYGFPWRFGNFTNPMSLPDYDPAQDRLINPNSTAASGNFYYNDPTFPPPPMEFTDPVINLGPNADFYRDPADGQIKSASAEGVPLAGLTPHRSPLGLVFDNQRALGDEFRGDGFVFSIGSYIAGGLAFPDSDEDMLHLDMEKVGDHYQMRVTRIADGFSEGPIDAVLLGNRVYMVEFGGDRTLWEITLPAGGDNTAVAEVADALPEDTTLGQNYPNPFNPSTTIDYQVGATGPIHLSIFNASGQKVRTLVNGQLAANRYSALWDGRDDQGRALASGAYLYRLENNGVAVTKQLTLIK